MFNSISTLFWQKKSDREEEEEGFEQGFHDLPHPKARASLSPEKLAILLSEQKAGTPAHILVEHELNLRIAQVQAHATYKASYIGIVGVVVGVVLTVIFAVLLLKYPPNETAQVERSSSKRDANGAAEVGVGVSTPARPAPEVPGVQPAQQPAQKQQATPDK